jgi:parallel beta-helix repeat protein
MKTALLWRAAAATDTGLARPNNEDRVLIDETRGLFLVVDGLGGHAAGETAAETAVQVIHKRLQTTEPDLDQQIRQAICAANNEIFALAQTHAEFNGMACVLTLAVAQHDRIHVGHVGDSRLYLLSNGKLKKLTSDHSPVGELEDQGELTEEQAMRHPRRNEVFRDVGSIPHQPADADFVETISFPFPADCALLLCSDGLSDYVGSAEVTAILESYDGDPLRTAQQLVEAGNAHGGHDNISVVFVAGADFIGSQSKASQTSRARHATTRIRTEKRSGNRFLVSLALLLVGAALGMLGWRLLDHLSVPATPLKDELPAPHVPREIPVNSANARGLLDALAAALPGDTIVVSPGDYLGPLILKEKVNIVATSPRQSIVRADPTATIDQAIGIVARHIDGAHIQGLRVLADDLHPLKIGILIQDSSLELSDMDIMGAIDSGVRIEGESHPFLLGNSIHQNPGAGVVIRDAAAPRLAGNHIVDNGLAPSALRAGIEAGPGASPVLDDNTVNHNGKPDAKQEPKPKGFKKEKEKE